MKKIAVTLSLIVFLFANDDTSKEDFIAKTRLNLLQHSWLEISGYLFFRPNDGEIIKKSINLKTQINQETLIFQVNINQTEKIRLYQKFGNIYESNELFNNLKKKNFFTTIGLNIADLSLSFMYWDLVKEMEKKRIGLHKCRVFLMRNPDDINFAKIFISKQYLAPLKVEWFTNLQKPSYQTLEFKSFSEKNSVWSPTKIQITNQKGHINIKADFFKAGKGEKNDLFEINTN